MSSPMRSAAIAATADLRAGALAPIFDELAALAASAGSDAEFLAAAEQLIRERLPKEALTPELIAALARPQAELMAGAAEAAKGAKP